MIKKKYLVTLSTLLLLLLLGLSSTTLGWSYELTVSDLRNINETLGSVKVNENFYTKCQQLLDQNYDCYFYTVYDSKKTARLVGWNNNCVQDNSTNNYVSLNATYGNYGYSSQYNNGNVNGSLSATGSLAFRFNSGWTSQNYWFISGNYQNSDGVMLREDPYQSVNILTLVEPTSFEFINTQNYSLVEVQTQADNFSYYNIPVAWTNKIVGTLNKSIFCDRIYYRVSAYNKNNNQFEIIADNVTLWEYSDGNNISNFFDTDTSSTYWSSVIDMNFNRYKNCCIYLFFDHSSTNTTGLVVPIYVSDRNTQYTYSTGGALMVSTDNTFSGDYLNEYDKNIDNTVNQQPVNDISNDIDNLITTITDSSYSGDITLPSIEIEDPTGDFFTWLYTSFVSVLNNNNNTYIDIPIWKTNYRIYSNVFMLPNGLLRDFISARLVVDCWSSVSKIY